MTALNEREAALAAENRHLKNRIRAFEGWGTRRQNMAEPEPARPTDTVGALLTDLARINPDAYQRIAPKLGRLA